jgi:hypothetical protein
MRTEMHIDLNERRVASTAKTMDLTGLDDQNVSRTGFEFLTVYYVKASTFPDELHLIVQMPMWSGPPPRQGAEEEGGDVDVAVLRSDELVRATLERQVLLTDSVHPLVPLERGLDG